ncbi:MAG: PilN domain-containing protein, partial [Hylemonella sp.]|nr:PilN domain-containing protein [Hylemonella sp.]
LWIELQMSAQRELNGVLQHEIKKLEAQIKEIDGLEAEIAAMRARQQAVEDLQSDRNQPVHLLNELVRLLPEGAQIKSMKQENQVVTLQGTAQSQERVSEFLRTLGNDSIWLEKPELIEIIASNLAVAKNDQRRVSNFTIRVHILKSSEVKGADGGSAETGGKPAAGGVPAVPAKQ